MRLDLRGRHPLLGLELPLRVRGPECMVIDSRGLTFAGPLDLAGTVAVVHGREYLASAVNLWMPTDADVASYLRRMDVLRCLPRGTRIDQDHPDGIRADRSSVLLEVTRLTPGNADPLSDRLGGMLAEHSKSRVAAAVYMAIAELIDNAVTHGASPGGAYLCAQIYTGATSGRPGFEFAVCDTGVGVLRRLRQNPANHDVTGACQALERATRPGATGTAEKRGNGLAGLHGILRDGGGVGRLVLRSGDGVASLLLRGDYYHERFKTTHISMKGTWAWLRVRFP